MGKLTDERLEELLKRATETKGWRDDGEGIVLALSELQTLRQKLEDSRLVALSGYVVPAELIYKRKTSVFPTAHEYGDVDKPYTKYTCPVCAALGNPHQVTEGMPNCPLCNVNLIWDAAEKEIENGKQ